MKEKIDKIWNDMFDKYISPSKYEKLCDVWDFNESFGGKIKGIATKEFIEKSLNDGFEVKAGWMATSIREYHDHYILTRRK